MVENREFVLLTCINNDQFRVRRNFTTTVFDKKKHNNGTNKFCEYIMSVKRGQTDRQKQRQNCHSALC